MLATDARGACTWGERASALAEQLGEREVPARASPTLLSACAEAGDPGGFVQVDRVAYLRGRRW
jgi:hypothetical protein